MNPSHPPSPLPVEVPSRNPGFAGDLSRLDQALAQGPVRVTVETLEAELQGRGFITIILILSLPFIQPIPVPGLSVLFGLGITALGVKIAMGKQAKLPRFLREKELERETVRRLIRTALRLFGKVEWLFGRRLSLIVDPPGLNMAGLSLIACGLALALPLPPVIPFSNGIPALGVFLLCLGLLERDGLVMLLGHIMAVFTWVYFGIWADLIITSLIKLPQWFDAARQRFCQDLLSAFCGS